MTIVIPCYNPPVDWVENIVRNLKQITQEIPETELVLVNDGSTKNFDSRNIEMLTMFLPQLIIKTHQINSGKGFTLREGVRHSTGELIIYTDVDFPYTYESFLKVYNALAGGSADVAIGIRGQDYYTHLPKARIRISKLLRWFIKKFLRIPADDTQCGLKGFNQKGKEIFLKTTINRYLFDLEFVFLAARNKLKIKTVEVELRPEVQLSKMNWKILLQEFGNFLKIFAKTIF